MTVNTNTPTHQKNSGTIKLQTTDPFDYPIIDPQCLTDKRGMEEFIAGIRKWEKFLETEPMKKIGAKIDHLKLSVCSKHEFRSDAYWECFVSSYNSLEPLRHVRVQNGSLE